MKRRTDQRETEESDRELKKSRLTNFHDFLVDDIVKIIFSLLDETSRRRVRLVCTKWFNYINYSVFNIGAILPSEIEEVVRVFGRYNKQIELHFKQKSPVLRPQDHQQVEQLSKLTNLSALTIGCFCYHRFLGLTNLTSLKSSSIGDTTMKTLTKLKKVVADDIFCDSTVNLAQLEELSLTGKCNFGGRIIARALNVKHLTLLKTEYPSHIEAGDTYCKEDFRLLTKLESLTVDDMPIAWDQLSTTLTSLIVMPRQEWRGTQHAVFQSTNLTNLRHLSIQNNLDNLEIFPYLESLSLKNFNTLCQQISSLSHLTSLKLSQFPVLEASMDLISELIQLCELELNPSTNLKAYDMKYFQELTNLTSLEISAIVRPRNIDTLTRLTGLQRLTLNFEDNKTDFLYTLTNLTRLHVQYDESSIPLSLKALMKLRELSAETEHTFTGFDTLTGLTKLRFWQRIKDSDSHWQNISKLTNLIEYMEVDGFISDPDRLTQLTVFKHLTRLITGSTDFYQLEHLTTLSRLQELDMFLDQPFDSEEIFVQKFPYLVDYKFMNLK